MSGNISASGDEGAGLNGCRVQTIFLVNRYNMLVEVYIFFPICCIFYGKKEKEGESGKNVFDFIEKYSYNGSQRGIFCEFCEEWVRGIKAYDIGDKRLCKLPSGGETDFQEYGGFISEGFDAAGSFSEGEGNH